MSAAVIKLSDKHHLEPGEQCGHCNLKAPLPPKCWWCSKPMEDWPEDAEQFLRDHDWEFSPDWKMDGTRDEEGTWKEPAIRYSGPVTEEMLAAAREHVSRREAFLKTPQLRRDEQTLAEVRAGLNLAKHELEQLEGFHASGEQVPIRTPWQFTEREAVRLQLNDALPTWVSELTKPPMYNEQDITKYEDSIKVSRRISQEDKLVINERKKQVQFTHHDRCHVCMQ